MGSAQATKAKALGSTAQAIQCDVLDESQQQAAFEQHLKAYGTIEAVCLNAGINETGMPQVMLKMLDMAPHDFDHARCTRKIFGS